MALRVLRSISLTIVLASVAVALSLALMVGWIAVAARSPEVSQQVMHNTWLLVAGVSSLLLITAVQIRFGVFLVREIREGHRQTTFIDSVTHELKSPLASLKLCLETLARPELSEAQRHRLRGMMLDDVDRLAVFIEDILVSTRVASRPLMDRGAYVVQEVPLQPLCERCADAVAKRHHLEPGAITVEVPGELALITDGTALETVLKNLLDNAAKYSEPPARVRLRAVVEGDQVRIEVEDEGIGIPVPHLKRVFDRFYRVPAEAVRARSGTGLGLFVVSALVRSLGGRVEAHSQGPGTGAMMRVTLPIDTPPRHLGLRKAAAGGARG